MTMCNIGQRGKGGKTSGFVAAAACATFFALGGALAARADGIEAWGSDRYVQDGLVAHFDGIENVASGEQHSDDAAQWTSLGGTAAGLKFNFSGRNGSTGAWRPDGRYFDGNAKGLTSADVTLGAVWTVQAAVAMPMDGQLTKTTTPASQYPAIFAADGDYISMYLNNPSAQTKTLYLKSDNYNGLSGNNRPNIATFGGKYVTAAVDTSATKKSYFTESGESLGSGAANTKNVSVAAMKYYIGGTDENHYIKGTMHSLRIYNKLLTDAEMAQNRAADEARFRGDGVIVRTSAEGLEGTEEHGFYVVDGSHVFTAPAKRTVGDKTFVCSGYTLQTYDSASDAWSAGETVESTSYTHTGGRACLTWLWSLQRSGFAWTGAAGDGKFSTLGNWKDLASGEAAARLPAAGDTLSFSAPGGGTIENDLEGLGSADLEFPAAAGQFTIIGNAFANVTNVVNESSSVQTISCPVAFKSTYNVALEKAVDFAGGATATLPGDVSGDAGTTLTGDITFTGTGIWVPTGTWTVPSGSKVTGRGQLGNINAAGGTFKVANGGYAHFATVHCGRNDTTVRLILVIDGTLEVDGELRYQNNGSGGNAEYVQGGGKIIAKAFYKRGGKQHFVTVGNFELGAGDSADAPGFGAIGASNTIQFRNNVTIRTMADMEFRSVYSSSEPNANGGICLTVGKTMTINTEDADGNGHTVIWGSSFCVKPSSGTGFSTSSATLRKAGKGKLVMRNKCSLTGSTGYKKLYNGNTHIDGGTLRVEDAGQLGKGSIGTVTYSGSTLNVNKGGTFELAAKVNLPNNVKLNAGGSIIAESGSTIVLSSSSGDNASITLGESATLTGNITLGKNATIETAANAKISGAVTIGDGSELTLVKGATLGGALKLSSGSAVVKVVGDYSSSTGKEIKITLAALDSSTSVENLQLDATDAVLPPKWQWKTALVEEDGNLVFHARREPGLMVILR